MKNKRKKLLLGLLAVCIIFTIVPMTEVQAKAPTKLGTKDFRDGSSAITDNGKTTTEYYNFLDWAKYGDYSYEYWYEGSFKTNRGIKIGSKQSEIIKKYGKAKKVKFQTNENFYVFLKTNAEASIYGDKYGYSAHWKNWKKCKYYMEYTYNKKPNKYAIRFYFDGNNKVKYIFFVQNIEKLKISNKKVDVGLKFKASTEKKITKKKINGKTVNLVPSNTKISVKNKNAKYAAVYLVKKNGKKEHIWPDCSMGCSEVRSGEKIASCLYEPSKKIASKEYYEIRFFDLDSKGGFNKPTSYYFKFK